jgi:AmpD protein
MKTHVQDVGRLHSARWLPSPNCDARPPAAALDLIVIHAISLPPGQFGGGAIEALFTNTLDCDAHPYYAQLRDLRVSAHFLIARDGQLTQFVDCAQRAWHAGVSSFCGRERCNDFSIGIELEGCDTQVFQAVQYRVLAGLLCELRGRYHSLRAAPLVAHSDIAPGRKTDPGPAFDWERLRRCLTERERDAMGGHGQARG